MAVRLVFGLYPEVQVDGLADFANGDGQLVVDRFDADVEDLRHFPVGQPIFAHQPENQFTAGRQVINGEVDPLHHFCRNHQLFGVEGGRGEVDGKIVEANNNVSLLFRKIVDGSIARTDVEINTFRWK